MDLVTPEAHELGAHGEKLCDGAKWYKTEDATLLASCRKALQGAALKTLAECHLVSEIVAFVDFRPQ